MIDPSARRQLHLVKSDYVNDAISMLRDLPAESVLTYYVVAAAEARYCNTLSDLQRARLTRLIGKLMKEIDKAA